MGKKGKKGKKNAQPPPLPELSPELTESLCKIQALQRGGLCRLQLRKAKERTATELLDEVLTLAWRQIRSHVLETKKARFAAETVLSQMNRVVAWNNFCYEESPLPVSAGDDTSPCGVAPSKPSHAWTFERQAQGVKVDRHSRYEVFAQPPTPPKIMRPKTPTSAKSHSGRGGSGRATTPGSSRRTGFKNGKRWESDGMEEAVEVVDLSDVRGHHNSKPSSKEGAGGLSGEDLLLSMMTPTEREYHFKMKAEAAERVRIATLEAEREELARAKAEEWEKRMREVAGKQWTVDADGTVIIVAPPKEKELGPHALPVKSTIKAGAFASPPPPEASRGGTITTMAAATTRSTEENGGGGGGGGSGAHAVVPTALAGATGDTATAGNGATAAAHFLKSVEVQPNLGEDRRFLPADGVELSALSPASGGKGRPQVKAGRAYQSPENRLTRVEYRRRIGFELPESDDRTKASGLSTLESDSLEGASVGSAAGGARKTTRSVPPSKRFPIIDPLQGGRKRSALKSKGGRRGAGAAGEPPTAGSKEERDLRGGGGVTGPSEGPEETSAAFGVETDGLGASEEAEKAKELERIHAMNREVGTGMRGSPVQSTVPAMSSGLQRPRALPHKHKDMRGVINSDHFPVGAIPTAYREKLAAPTKLGVVTGHGDATLPLPSSSKVSQGGDDEGGGYLDGKNNPTAAEISPQKGGLGSGSAPLGQTLSRVTIPEEIQEQRLHYDIGMSSTGRRRGSTRGSSKGNPS